MAKRVLNFDKISKHSRLMWLTGTNKDNPPVITSSFWLLIKLAPLEAEKINGMKSVYSSKSDVTSLFKA